MNDVQWVGRNPEVLLYVERKAGMGGSLPLPVKPTVIVNDNYK